MKRIKEKELRDLIKAHIKEGLNCPFVFDNWFHLEKYLLTEGLTMTYSVNKVVGILERKYDLKKNGIKVSWGDSDINSKDIFISFRKNDKTTQESENWYHVCLLRVVSKILKQGLAPRNNGRIASHTERVYLFLEYNNEWKNDVASNFKESGKEEPYAYLKIDTRNIIPQIKFYYESNVMTNNPAIYTLEPTPPSVIKLIDKEGK